MYQEQPYNPAAFAGTIADLITRPAEARAAALRANGIAQAQAVQTGGQAAAGAANQIGQTVAAIPGQIQQNQENAQRQQIQQAQIDAVNQQKAGRLALAQAIKAHIDPKTGEVDHEAVAKDVSAAGFPDQGNAWLKVSSENADNLAKLRDLTEKQAQHYRETIGDLAYSAKTPEEFSAGIGLLAATPGGGMDEQQAHALADKITADPDQAAKIKAQFIQFSPKYEVEQKRLQTVVNTPAGGTSTTVGRAESGEQPLVVNPKEAPVGDFKGPTTNFMNKATGNPAEIDQHTGAYLDTLTHEPIAKGNLVEVAPPRNPEVTDAAAQAHKDAQDARDKAAQTASYQFHTGQVDKLAAPVEDSQKQLSNLRTLIDQHTPQADADVAPKLLTVFAGGAGSGLRMNQSTIDRNAGGHTAWVGLQQALNKFSTDPAHATIPEAQRQQIYQLLGAAESQIDAKTTALESYRDVLSKPDSTPAEHRQGLSDLHKAINTVETGSIGKAPSGGLKQAAAAILKQNGKASDDAAVAMFLKNNPSWTP